jgi:frataxin-like iron-binding protein CyaY
VAYITLNRRSAKRIIWRALLDIIEEYDIDAKLDNTELTITLPNKNVIHISGAKDETDAEKLRGMAIRKVYIDECQSFRGYIEQLIDDIIEPALTDFDGSLILIGTPGPVPSGYFYEASQSPGWSHHHWTLHDNPWILKKSGKTAEQIITERCQRRGISRNDPSILREYYGQWVKDENSLVYKFDSSRNIYKELPENLKYVIGIDIGWVDSDAIAVLGYSHTDKNVYLVHENITSKQTISDLVDKIKDLEKLYSPVKMVMDAGALGKKIQEEIRQRHRLSVHAA